MNNKNTPEIENNEPDLLKNKRSAIKNKQKGLFIRFFAWITRGAEQAAEDGNFHNR